MNIDGLAKQGVTTGGGVLRNDKGNFMGAFSNFYGDGTNTWAELCALRDGLMFCLALEITPLIVESDSLVVVQAVRVGVIGNWRLEYPFRDCMKLISSSVQIIHGYRQINHVADRLAAVAHLHKQRQEFFRPEDLPLEARKALVADNLGLWNFRA